MWRRAHGRMAAIVVLAGGLFDCAHAPETTEDDEHDEHRMHCGYVPALDPQQIAARILESARKYCGPGAAAGGRFGEVRAVMHPGDEGPPAIEVDPDSSLNEDDRRCVAGTALGVIHPGKPATGRKERRWNDVRDDVVLYGALGSAPPLLPSSPAFIDRWREATRSKAAREQLQAELPEEVAAVDDCLTMPARPGFTERLERWLATVDTPLADIWQPGDGLFADPKPLAGTWKRAFLVGDRTMLVHHLAAIDAKREEICLLPLDDRRWEAARASVDRRATCWAGDLREVLLHPRTRFPAELRYGSVAVGDARACALDQRGAPVCCGERLVDDVTAGPFTALAVGGGFDCGLAADGAMACWGAAAPDIGDGVGPFSHIAVSAFAACAIRRDSGALQCRLAKPPPAFATIPLDKPVALAGVDDGFCVLHQDGRVHCWGTDLWRGWSELDGLFNAFSASGNAICGVTTAGDAVRCWRDRPGWPWPKSRSLPSVLSRLGDPSGVAPWSGVALSGGDACVLGRSGHISCVSETAHRWTGLYRAIAGGGRGICAVTADGRVECDREWPHADK